MKKFLKKTGLCLLAALMLLGTLSSCVQKQSAVQERLPFEEVYNTSFIMHHPTAYTTAKQIALPAGKTQTLKVGDGFLSYLDNENHYCIYGIDSGSVVLKLDTARIEDSADVSLQNGDLSCIRVIETDPETKAKTTSVYNKHGKLLCSGAGILSIRTAKNGFTFGGRYYHVENDEIKKEFAFINPTACQAVYDDTILSIRDSSAIYYNEDLKVIASYTLPKGAESHTFYPLSDGKLLVQYSLQSGYLSKTYMKDDIAFALYHELFDPTTEITQRLDLGNVYICDVLNRKHHSALPLPSFEEVFTEKVENVIAYSAIIDGRIDSSVTHSALLGNDGALGASLEYVEGQTGLILPLRNGNYYAPTKNGYTILDTKGSAICEIESLELVTEFGFLASRRIYNKSFHLVRSVADGSQTVLSDDNRVATFYCNRFEDGTTRYYRYDKNGDAEILPPPGRVFVTSPYTLSIVNSADWSFYVTEHYDASAEKPFATTPLYSFYSLYGDHLFTTKTFSVRYVAEGEHAVVCRILDAQGNYLYMRLARE